MDCNAKQNKKDVHGNTPLIYACLNGQHEIAALLLEVRLLHRKGYVQNILRLVIFKMEPLILQVLNTKH